jgi:hypothetical protein
MLLKDDDDDDFRDLDMSPDPDDNDEEARAEAERMFMRDQTDIVGDEDLDDAEDDSTLPDVEPVTDDDERDESDA